MAKRKSVFLYASFQFFLASTFVSLASGQSFYACNHNGPLQPDSSVSHSVLVSISGNPHSYAPRQIYQGDLASLATYNRIRPVATQDILEQWPPNFFYAPQILLFPEKCVAYNKNKNLAPTNTFCLPNLKIWIRACFECVEKLSNGYFHIPDSLSFNVWLLLNFVFVSFFTVICTLLCEHAFLNNNLFANLRNHSHYCAMVTINFC